MPFSVNEVIAYGAVNTPLFTRAALALPAAATTGSS